MKKIAILAIIILASCTKKRIAEVEQGMEYYPAKPGRFIIYEVDSTVYTQLPRDTISYRYLIKEKLAETFIDNQGKEAYRMERYIKRYNPLKSYDSLPWLIKEVWMVNINDQSVQVVESNIRFTKLIFPVAENEQWNGNALNATGDWQYTYDYINATETINKTSFAKVLKVNQKYYETKISLQNYNEKYAHGIGLVSRQIVDVNSGKNLGIPILNRIESGIVYNQVFLSSGYE